MTKAEREEATKDLGEYPCEIPTIITGHLENALDHIDSCDDMLEEAADHLWALASGIFGFGRQEQARDLCRKIDAFREETLPR